MTSAVDSPFAAPDSTPTNFSTVAISGGVAAGRHARAVVHLGQRAAPRQAAPEAAFDPRLGLDRVVKEVVFEIAARFAHDALARAALAHDRQLVLLIRDLAKQDSHG